ncbi:MAG: S8/S53 family peptidase [Saprospiraceae bacterium]|nr:S8/S53 family peptidase [Saprospiraceae bacterium]
MATLRFTLGLSIIFLILIWATGCCDICKNCCKKPEPVPSPSRNIATIRGSNLQYVVNQFILDTSDPDIDLNRIFLDSLEFDLVNACDCDLPFELWVNPSMTPVDVGTVVSRGNTSGQPAGGILPNVIIKNQLPISFTRSMDKLVPQISQFEFDTFPNSCLSSSNTIQIVILDTGIDSTFDYGNTNSNWYYNLNNGCIENSNIFGIHLPTFANGHIEPFDSLGHGCSVNSILGGVSNYNFNLSNLHIKTSNVSIFNKVDTSTTFMDFLCGMVYAISQQPNIINLSLGFKFEINSSVPLHLRIDSTIQNDLKYVIELAASNNITIVAAMGNDSVVLNDNVKFYPAYLADRYNNFISIGSTDVNGGINTISSFSNRADFNHMNTTAPGNGITACFPKYLQTSDVPTGFANMSGTSFSTPYVSRLLAAILAKNPGLTPAQLKDTLINVYSTLHTPPLNGLPFRSIKNLNEIKNLLCQ